MKIQMMRKKELFQNYQFLTPSFQAYSSNQIENQTTFLKMAKITESNV